MLALLDDASVKHCVVTSWSTGTAVALELARRHPDRVRGLLLLGGPPTSGAELVLDTLGVPERLRRLLAAGGSVSLRALGDLLEAIGAAVPGPLLGHAELTLNWSAARRSAPTDLTCPVTLMVGRRDPLAEPRATIRTIAALPQARIRILDATHLLPFEAPGEVRAELELLMRRALAVDFARLGLDPPPPSVPRLRVPIPQPAIRRTIRPLD